MIDACSGSQRHISFLTQRTDQFSYTKNESYTQHIHGIFLRYRVKMSSLETWTQVPVKFTWKKIYFILKNTYILVKYNYILILIII